MPAGTAVDSCYQKLKLSHGEASAARICQHATGQALATGKPPKKKFKLTNDERAMQPQLLMPSECKSCKHRNVDMFENTSPMIGAGA